MALGNEGEGHEGPGCISSILLVEGRLGEELMGSANQHLVAQLFWGLAFMTYLVD